MSTSFDDELMTALQEDGRASYSLLARRLRSPRAVVSARVRELIEDGALRIVAAADPAFLGDNCLAHVTISGRSDLRGVVDKLMGREDIPLISATSGAQDLVIEVRAPDQSALFDVLTYVRAFDEVARLRTAIYTNILRGSFASDYQGGGSIDLIDRELVELLRDDGRMSYRNLAREVRLSPTTVRSRVRRMIDDRILRIGAVVAHGAHADRIKVGIGLHLGGEDTAVTRRLMSYPETEFAALSVGPFDLIATLSASVSGDVLSRLNDLKELTGVTGMETWFHLQTLKEDYSRAI